MFAVMLAHFIFQLLFLSFPCFNGFHYYYYCHYFFTLVYFDQLPLNDFKCDWCTCFVLSSFYLFISSLGARGWVVDTVGNRGGSI